MALEPVVSAGPGASLKFALSRKLAHNSGNIRCATQGGEKGIFNLGIQVCSGALERRFQRVEAHSYEPLPLF